MKRTTSLSTKLIAAIFTLVALAFAADSLLIHSISERVYERTQAMTAEMRSIMQEKDSQIDTLLTDLLATKESGQDLQSSLVAAQLQAEGTKVQSFLDGERHGISVSVASLVSSAMMTGDTSAALDQIEILLENEQIAAINLWRTDGSLAFRDNATIEAVNTYVEAEAFDPREIEPAITIPPARQRALKDALANQDSAASLEATLDNDEGETVPVIYSYFVLKNSEDCQGCHDPKDAYRGVVEVAVDSSALIAQRAGTQRKIAELKDQLQSEQALLIKANEAERQKVTAQTDRYTVDIGTLEADLTSTQSNASLMSVGAKIAFFLITVFLLGLALRHMLTRPLDNLTSGMLRLAEDDLSVEATGQDRRDEIGAMSRAIAIFKDNAVKRHKLERESADHMQEQKERQRTIDALLSDFRAQIQQSLATVSTRAESMQVLAASLNSLSSETSTRARSADDASSQSAENVDVMATASTDMIASIAEISEQVGQTNELVSAASEEARETDAKVAGLANAAMQIGEVVSLIQDIAEQTNLLALNATIEAARAGEMGRGFAVVASEVKGLAAQTGKATEDIASRIEAIQASTTESVDAIRSIATKMGDISVYTEAMSEAIREQNASTHKISQNIQEAASGTRAIVADISGVAASTEETRTSASEVESASRTVAHVASDMRKVIDAFLDKVAAA